MLTRADDYPVHQTAEPIASVATGDRNFYDRYFFNGYSRDGEVFFAVALGVYPNRSVMDAAVSVVYRGRQTALRASRLAPPDRVETIVGPITVEVVEPLRQLRVIVRRNDLGVEMDARFSARAAAIEEPRFTRRARERLVMDYTRLTQHGCWEGKLTVDGKTLALAPDRTWGSRDRSWGVRPLGEPEAGAGPPLSQFFWLWSPCNFPETVSHFDVNEEADGTRWHEMGALAPVATPSDTPGRPLDPGGVRLAHHVAHKLTLRPGTRRAERAELELRLRRETVNLVLTPLYDFSMSGLGYLHPEWGHGCYHGHEEVSGESWALKDVDPGVPLHLHVQSVCEAKLTGQGVSPQSGIGVLEQLILGPHEPYGLGGLLGGAGAS
jgi:hypothetical protein